MRVLAYEIVCCAMSTDDLLVRHEKSDDSTSTSTSPPTPTPTPVPNSSLSRLRNTFRRTESISNHIINQISTQFSNAAAAAAASEIIDGTTTYPEMPQTVATVSNTPTASTQPKRKKPGEYNFTTAMPTVFLYHKQIFSAKSEFLNIFSTEKFLINKKNSIFIDM